MGQYHMLINVDRKELVYPHDIGLGLKQWEHAGYGGAGTLADAMYILTMTSPNRGGGDFEWTAISGRWVGDRVMVVGDYTEDEDIPDSVEITHNGQIVRGSDLYWYAQEEYDNISGQVAVALETIFDFQIKDSESGWKDRVSVDA